MQSQLEKQNEINKKQAEVIAEQAAFMESQAEINAKIAEHSDRIDDVQLEIKVEFYTKCFVTMLACNIVYEMAVEIIVHIKHTIFLICVLYKIIFINEVLESEY